MAERTRPLMQAMFIGFFAISLVFFSFLVRVVVSMTPYLLAATWPPRSSILWGLLWLIFFLLSFAGTGLYLYELEREEGRIAKRIPLYEALLRRRRPRRSASPAKTIRRANAEPER